MEVGKEIVDSLNKYVRVRCGFAGVKDVRTLTHEDRFVFLDSGKTVSNTMKTCFRMDSFVLAETFKYLYLLFAEREDILFDVDNYIFTTEAHFLPLTVSSYNKYYGFRPVRINFKTFALQFCVRIVPFQGTIGAPQYELVDSDERFSRSCPNAKYLFKDEMNLYAKVLRTRMKDFVSKFSPQSQQ